MPKSKRAKMVSLTKVSKKTKEQKGAMMEQLQVNADKWKYCWVFQVGNMRNSHLKIVRRLWHDSARIFFGRSAVMAKGLGTTVEEEHLPGLHQLSRHIKGQVGLFFTDTPPDEVVAWFEDFHPLEFARSGTRATKTIVVPAGPVMQHHSDPPEPLSHSVEPQLRKLGLRTTLKKGVPMLETPQRICEKGKKLTPEQAQLLKLVGEKTVEFKVRLKARWDKETGSVVMGPDDGELEDDVDDNVEGNDVEQDEEVMSE